MDTTLVIMAAGIGSRFGGGIKQLEPVGPCGEIIMDYSIFDALNAGFNKVVFIIRHDIEKDFKEIIGDRISRYVNTEYVYQENNLSAYGYSAPEQRKKPYGTGHAVLSCKGVVNEPFMVINADDYYGREAFRKVHDYLVDTNDEPGRYCMAGFVLGNTLSDNGTVKRGVCKTDENDFLLSVEECGELMAAGDVVSGVNLKGEKFTTSYSTPVSMNMFGFTSDFILRLDEGFREFLENADEETMLKGEFYLPSMVSELIDTNRASVKVLSTDDRWIGVTYREDKPMVVQAIRKMVEDGMYEKGILR